MMNQARKDTSGIKLEVNERFVLFNNDKKNIPFRITHLLRADCGCKLSFRPVITHFKAQPLNASPVCLSYFSSSHLICHFSVTVVNWRKGATTLKSLCISFHCRILNSCTDLMKVKIEQHPLLLLLDLNPKYLFGGFIIFPCFVGHPHADHRIHRLAEGDCGGREGESHRPNSESKTDSLVLFESSSLLFPSSLTFSKATKQD